MDYIIGMFYYKPAIYTVSHLALGFAAAWYPVVGAVMVVYQLLQLALNVRFFLFEMKIREGNTWQHTALKLSEVGLGYVIGLYVRGRV